MIKIIIRAIIISILVIIAIIAGSDSLIHFKTRKYLFGDKDEIPTNKVGLVLGTSKNLRGGHPNPYFTYRINAAVKLYKAGRIRYLIVSGDNSIRSYNEPKYMRDALIKAGVPKEKIYLDYAGFRTFDSIIRCKEIFGQSKFTVISQPFHNERAVFIARSKGLKAIGFNAKDVGYQAGLKTQLREKLARVKTMIDLFLINQKPKYLGDKIHIGD